MKTKEQISFKKKQSKVKPQSPSSSSAPTNKSTKEDGKQNKKQSDIDLTQQQSNNVQESRAYNYNVTEKEEEDDPPSNSRSNLKSGVLDLSQFSGFLPPSIQDARVGNDLQHLEYTRHYQSTAVNQLESKVSKSHHQKSSIVTTTTTAPTPIPTPWHSPYDDDHDLNLELIKGRYSNQGNYLSIPDTNHGFMMTSNDHYPHGSQNPVFSFSPTHSLRVDDKFSPDSPDRSSYTSSTSNHSSSDNPSLQSTYIDLNDDVNFPGLKTPHNNSIKYPTAEGVGSRHRTQHEGRPEDQNIPNGKRPFQVRPRNNKKHVTIDLGRKKVEGGEPSRQDKNICDIVQKVLFGNSSFIREFLDRRQDQAMWAPGILLEIFFRSICATSLSSNVLSGLLIFIAIVIVAPFSILLGSWALVSGTFTSIFILQIPLESLRGGTILFNSFLMGMVIGQQSTTAEWSECLSIFIITFMAGSMVIFMWYGFEGLFVRLPQLNASFNLLAILYLKGFVEPFKSSSSSLSSVQVGINQTTTMELDPMRVLEGILLAPTSFYFTSTLWSSSLVYFAWFIFSPIFTFQAIIGATIGSLIGILLTSDMDSRHYTLIYNGGWAYNPLLTSMAIGLLFVYNLKGFIMSIVGSALTALLYGAMIKTELPVFGIPFMLVTQLILAMSQNNVNTMKISSWMVLLKVNDVTTPEVHLKKFIKKLNRNRPKKEKKSKKRPPPTPIPMELHL